MMIKNWVIGGILLACLIFAGRVFAQSTTIDWWGISGGGGSESSGGVSLDGSTGQWAAGSDSRGAIQLDAGFWHGLSGGAGQTCFTLDLTALPAAGGSIQANPAPDCGSQYTSDTVVTLTATAKPNYTFTNWGGDADGSNNPLSISMTGHRTVTAHYAISYKTYIPVTLKN